MQFGLDSLLLQEALLPQRDSASATHVFLGSLNDRALHWTLHLLYNYIYKMATHLKIS